MDRSGELRLRDAGVVQRVIGGQCSALTYDARQTLQDRVVLRIISTLPMVLDHPHMMPEMAARICLSSLRSAQDSVRMPRFG